MSEINDHFISPDEAALWGGTDSGEDWLYTVVSFDPGGTTGWSVIAVHPDAITDPDVRIADNVEYWTAGEFTGDEDSQADEMVELCATWPSARLVIEDFRLRKFSAAEELLSPVRLIAITRWALRPRYFIRQQPALAMTTITDERQKAMGFWLPGKTHARDALKHNLTWLKRAKERATVEGRRSGGSANG